MKAQPVKTALLTLFLVAAHSVGFGADVVTEHKMFAERLGHPSRSWTIKLDGLDYTSIEELKLAVERLPPGSKLTWYTGCFLFLDVPLGSPPRIKLADFEKFCSGHGITFTTNNEGSW